MDFLKEFEKTVSKMEGVGKSSEPPRYYHSFGNYVLNRIMAGHFKRGVGQGRLTGITGPSGAGKSFILGNLVKQAQMDDAYILIIDSENALDDQYMNAIGVDTENGYNYNSVTTIPQVSAIISAFLKGYKKAYGIAADAPKIFIAIDSLDMLMTETEVKHYDSGDAKGDQGQRAKQIKAMLRTFVQDIKELNVSMAVTSQVYPNQDLLNGEGLWMVNQSVRYALSQIVLVTKLKLKDDKVKGVELTEKTDDSKHAGINMKCVGFKTRFTKPFQEVTIQVPYETGMDPFNGLLSVAKKMGVVDQRGSRYALAGEDQTFFEKDFVKDGWAQKTLDLCEQQTDAILTVDDDSIEEDVNVESKSETTARRKKAAAATTATTGE
jgi:RecA/RadA recombinase